MKIGAFELNEPLPELREPHAIAMIRPWVDVGSVGTLTLARIERHLGAQELGKLSRPGTFFDFTRYRPNTKLVNGARETTVPNTFLHWVQPDNGRGLVFLHLLEPHAMAEEYVESIAALLQQFRVRVYCRIGSMYDSVPHSRPIIVTGNPGPIEPRPGAAPPLIQQRQSQYEGPTTILNTLVDAVTAAGIESMSFMAHLPHYAQLDEDFAGTARMVEVLSAFYDIPASLAPNRRGKRQYTEIEAAVERQAEVKALVGRLEAYYDSKYPSAKGEAEAEAEPREGPPTLSPEIERFLKDLDLGL